MILVLSDGGLISSELYDFLSSEGIKSVFHFSSFEDAGNFGKGHTIVGKAGYRSFVRELRRGRISAVIDIIEEPCSKTSAVMLAAAGDLGIPVIKLAVPVCRFDFRIAESFAEHAGVVIKRDYSYASVAETINNTVGNVLFLARPYNVRAIAELVFDRSALYAPILGGSEFDVGLALEYGIPILNITEVDGLSGEDKIKKLIDRFEARLVVSDDPLEAAETIKAVSDRKADLIFIQNTGLDYEYMTESFDMLRETLKKCLADRTDNISDETADAEQTAEEVE